MTLDELQQTFFEAVDRLEQSIQRLSERVDRLEYGELNNLKSDVYHLERVDDELRRDISNLESRVR